jgi:3-phenylpropionate/trans-cinnamate dioxygenase ferredoxin subunit
VVRYVVASVDEIPPGGRKIVKVGGRSIGVFNLDGEFFALRNQCPHQGGPLCKGRLAGLIQSPAPGEFTYTRRGEFLRCPWHAWEFDVRTGQSWVDPKKLRVRSYKTTIEGGDELSEREKELKQAGLEKGPYSAETYPVSVEQRYVVLEVR